MLRLGLTGGIACGKSTVAAILGELGCAVIDADLLAHRLIEPGQPAYNDVVRVFGGEVLDAEGRIDRALLGRIVFADRARLAELNRIVHPLVIAETERRFAELAKGSATFAFVEAALLVEAGYDKQLDRLVVCWCRAEQQLERLLARGMPREQAEQRIAAQMPIEEKRKLADDVLDCSGTLEVTRQQTEALVVLLRALSSA